MPNANSIYLCFFVSSDHSRKMLYAAHHAVTGRTGGALQKCRWGELVDSSSIICENLADVLFSFLPWENVSREFETAFVMDFSWQISVPNSELFAPFKLVLDGHILHLCNFFQGNPLQFYKVSRSFSDSILCAYPTIYY